MATNYILKDYSTIGECNKATKIPNEAFDIIEDVYAFKIYTFLLMFRDVKDGISYITRDNLIKDVKMSKTKVKECIKYLKSIELIEEVNKSINGRAYKLLKPLLYVDDEKEERLSQLDIEYYVYIHIDKNTNEVLYVGKGTGDRFKDLTSRNDTYLKYINTLGKDNIECRIIKYFEDEAEAYNYEKEITDLFKSLGQAKYSIKSGF